MPEVPILLQDVRGYVENADSGTSRINKEEMNAVEDLVKRCEALLDERTSVAVLSPYGAQARALKNKLEGT